MPPPEEVFPSEVEFTKWCSCEECSHKIKELKDNVENIQSKWLLVLESKENYDRPLEQCFSLAMAMDAMELFMGIIEKNLRINEEFGMLSTLAALAVKFKNSVSVISKFSEDLLRYVIEDNLSGQSSEAENDPIGESEDESNDPIGESEDESKDPIGDSEGESKDVSMYEFSSTTMDETDETDALHMLSRALQSAMYNYIKFGGDEGTLDLIRRMQIELARSKGKLRVDPSTFKELIEHLIEFVQSLPVDSLYGRLVGLKGKAIRRNYYWDKFVSAESLINSVVLDLGKFEVNGNGNHHSLNEFNQTLDSLLNTVNTFNKRWKDEYDPLFEEFHRTIPLRDPSHEPDPKQPRTE